MPVLCLRSSQFAQGPNPISDSVIWSDIWYMLSERPEFDISIWSSFEWDKKSSFCYFHQTQSSLAFCAKARYWLLVFSSVLCGSQINCYPSPLSDLVIWLGRISNQVWWHALPYIQTASDGNVNVHDSHCWLAQYNRLADTSIDAVNAESVAYYSQS